MPVMSKPQKRAIKATARIKVYIIRITSADRWGRRTNENFLPALKHRQREGRLEADSPPPKNAQKRRTWGSIDQRQVHRKEGRASVVVALFRGHGRCFCWSERALPGGSPGPNYRLQVDHLHVLRRLESVW
jgi:hypothetical protein